MLIAVQQDNIINAISVDHRQACEILSRGIGRELDGEEFNILSEILNPMDQVIVYFKDLPASDFIKACHQTHVTRDPLYHFDDFITYQVHDYVLFDLDQNKIKVPDYYNHQPEMLLYDSKELDSSYKAYEYVAGNLNLNKPVQHALKENLILVKPSDRRYSINNCVIKSVFVFRDNSPKSKEIDVEFCYCCRTFECQCSDEEIESFTADLPF